MKTYKKIAVKTIILATILTGLTIVSLPMAAAAQCTDNSPACGGPSGNTSSTTTTTDSNCNNSSDAGINKCLKNNQIVKDINFIVDFLAGGVGIVVIATIIVGGVQYSLAGDNATATAAARQRITNGLIALAAFIFTFAFLQWLIPGGL
jgi:hypothetical protein